MRCESLHEVREQIDRIDEAIIALLAKRGELVAQAAAFKKSEDGVRASDRVEQVIDKVRQKASALGADPDMVEALYREMIRRFVQKEMSIYRSASK